MISSKFAAEKKQSSSSAFPDGPRLYRMNFVAEQKAAMRPMKGTRSIVATAGSGKTTTMAGANATLILEHGVPERKILATTFTNPSAADLKMRIDEMTGRVTAIQAGTLHSVATKLLQAYGHLIGYKGRPMVVDEADSKALMKQCAFATFNVESFEKIKNAKKDDFPRWALEAEVRALSSLPGDRDPYFKHRDPVDHLKNSVLMYKRLLKENNQIDYDLILSECVRLLRMNDGSMDLPSHVFIDEAQDLSAVQWLMVEELAKTAEFVCVIGDDDQSIYYWRRALPARFVNFVKSSDETIYLTSNRRCAQKIVKLAAEVISSIPSSRRIDKNLTAAREEPGEVKVVALPPDKVWYLSIQKSIVDAVAEGSLKYSDFAVIYRGGSEIKSFLEGAFGEAKIPYRVLGGKSSFESPESKLARSTIGLFTHEGDRAAEPHLPWANALEAVGVSAGAASTMIEGWNRRLVGDSVSDGEKKQHLKNQIQSNNRIDDKNKDAAMKLTNMIFDMRDRYKSRGQEKMTIETVFSDDTFNNIIEGVVTRNVSQMLDKQTKEEKRITPEQRRLAIESSTSERLQTLSALFSAYQGYDPREALTLIELSRGNEKNEDGDLVTLTTAHSSKGLEWDSVYVVEANGSSWPSSMANEAIARSDDEDEVNAVLDEERRLLYVAITRAKNKLFIMSRSADAEFVPLTPTPFLPKEIAQEYQEILGEALMERKLKRIVL